ncbi:MAG: cell division protein ZapA [Phycisphaerae bacterium]|nr:cell division protein ZapA [Phycisphaerae bacterium]NIW96167.1 cell division protein ZapA [Phycisphaerae bacterium]
MEQLVTIELFGKQHTFKAESDVQQAKEIAEVLVKEVSRVENQQSARSSAESNLTTLMLAALNIVHQNRELENRHSEFRQNLSERSLNLIRQLDDVVSQK